MSTLVAQTISNGTVSTSSANVIQGSAKAWVNWDGSSGSGNTVRGSYNVSSISRTATGQFQINFTNAFADTNYVVQVTGMRTDTNILAGMVLGNATYTNSYLTGSVYVNFRDNSNQNLNPLAGNVTVFR